jgi:prolyl-tRNA synthetase
MYEAYRRIFSCCGVEAIPVEAETGFMGGEDSHEFMVLAESGEDTVVRCSACSYAASKDRAARDCKLQTVEEIRYPKEGDPCPKCGKPLALLPAIEVGHIFKLGTKYSTTLGATFLDEDGKQRPFIMGCYGIGVTRILAAVIEAHHDDAGIRWPASIAPFPVVIVPINLADPATRKAAEDLYRQAIEQGLDLILDDREVSGGVKLKDADLIGFPYRVLLSEKTLQQSSVELKAREEDQPILLKRVEAISTLKKRLDKEAIPVG